MWRAGDTVQDSSGWMLAWAYFQRRMGESQESRCWIIATSAEFFEGGLHGAPVLARVGKFPGLRREVRPFPTNGAENVVEHVMHQYVREDLVRTQPKPG